MYSSIINFQNIFLPVLYSFLCPGKILISEYSWPHGVVMWSHSHRSINSHHKHLTHCSHRRRYWNVRAVSLSFFFKPPARENRRAYINREGAVSLSCCRTDQSNMSGSSWKFIYHADRSKHL